MSNSAKFATLLVAGIVISCVGLACIFVLPLLQAYAIVAVGVVVLHLAGNVDDDPAPAAPSPHDADAERKREAEERLKQTQAVIDDLDRKSEENKKKLAQIDRRYAPTIKASVVASFRHKYRVVGVTYDNDDGSSRQEILEAIANAEPPYEDCEVSLDEFDYNGERALAVNVNGDCIGNISRKDLDDVFSDLCVADSVDLRVYGGENGRNYGASVTLVFDPEID